MLSMEVWCMMSCRTLGILYLGIALRADAETPDGHLGRLCTQKMQGRSPTCHAFALSCPIEAFESKAAPNFSVSSNWLVFVSAMDRLCASASPEQVRVHR